MATFDENVECACPFTGISGPAAHCLHLWHFLESGMSTWQDQSLRDVTGLGSSEKRVYSILHVLYMYVLYVPAPTSLLPSLEALQYQLGVLASCRQAAHFQAGKG